LSHIPRKIVAFKSIRMRYFLIGYKSSGKTTLGKQLATKLKMRFIDMDHYMEERENKSIPEIYTELGDDKFRVLESEVLKEIVKTDNVVVSTGGGTPCHFNNMDIMRDNGEVIYIKVDDDILIERLKTAVSKNRPIVKNKSEQELKEYVSNLRKKREHFYDQAHHVIYGRNIQVGDIIDLLQFRQHS
jgi:shikimate kinase